VERFAYTTGALNGAQESALELGAGVCEHDPERKVRSIRVDRGEVEG
jgi:hypothetical protein